MPSSSPPRGIAFGRAAGADAAPDQRDAGARVEPAGQHRRDSVTTLAQREDEVLGQVRPGGVAAGAVQADADVVGRRR